MNSETELHIECVTQLPASDRQRWLALAGDYPFLNPAMLDALHDNGCASKETGWTPHYLLVRKDHILQAGTLVYLKNHSRGEYVFDQTWAEAYYQHGLHYYPKLLVAIPFTPVRGPRLLAEHDSDRRLLAKALIALAQQWQLSSVHVLFPEQNELDALQAEGFLLRNQVQFHWCNRGYACYDEFLAALQRDKRKKLNQASRHLQQSGIEFRWLVGDDIDTSTLEFFYRCYQQTYREHFSTPYLTFECFQRWQQTLGNNLLLLLASQDGQDIACALNIRDRNRLYGRYWGALEFVPELHFETCYSQAIRFCIEHGIEFFEGGAQGEHKLARGLEPVQLQSAHWIADPRFAAAIDDFLQREQMAIDRYFTELQSHTPFKS